MCVVRSQRLGASRRMCLYRTCNKSSLLLGCVALEIVLTTTTAHAQRQIFAEGATRAFKFGAPTAAVIIDGHCLLRPVPFDRITLWRLASYRRCIAWIHCAYISGETFIHN